MANNSIAHYEYKPLAEKDAIRIIQLKSAVKNQQSVDCHLLLVSPKDAVDKPGRVYEALSWCWGPYNATHDVRIHSDRGSVRIFKVSESLFGALKALRYVDRDRYLWVDAICINQQDAKEKAEQVPRMDTIYGGASNVCIWLGPQSNDSALAIDFIEQQVLQLWDFDELCKSNAKEWDAVVKLMKRPWFSRRWIVQEIALATRATVYCGDKHISWYKFANAVALVVEVESASRRLSEVIREHPEFNNLRGYFGNVPTFGAALLVETTSYLFSTSPSGDRLRLSTLENLVSRSAIFATSEPRDIVYGLLAMAKDSNPKTRSDFTALPVPANDTQASRFEDGGNKASMPEVSEDVAANQRSSVTSPTSILARLFGSSKSSKGPSGSSKMSPSEARRLLDEVRKRLHRPEQEPYEVDYKNSVLDIYRHFIAFSIRKADPTRALDIICRPWAAHIKCRDEWKYLEMEHEGNMIDKCKHPQCSPYLEEKISLPSWMPSVDHAPFALDDGHRTRGADGNDDSKGRFFTQGMTRVNADPLVGAPDSPMRRYAAAGTKTIDWNKIRFARRLYHENEPWLEDNHYSMFVEGFVIDRIEKDRLPASQAGGIPREWLSALGWDANREELPEPQFESFWRTLVADRGAKGSNPPLFYDLSCREVLKRDLRATTIDTTKLIHDGYCSIVAEFLRRVQATIWGKKFFLTEGDNGTKGPRMGLVRGPIEKGDEVCILYGCSVPVILRRKRLEPVEVEREQKYDEKELQKKVKRAGQKIHEWQRKLAARKQLKRRKRTYWRRLIDLLPTIRVLFFLGMASYVRFVNQDSLSTAWFLCRLPITAINLLPDEVQEISHRVRAWLERVTQRSPLEKFMTGILSIAVVAFVFSLQLPWDRVALLVGAEILLFGMPKNVRSMAKNWWNRSPPMVDKATQLPQEGHYYEFVGEAYVHGIMNGEAIAWQNETGTKPQLFELR